MIVGDRNNEKYAPIRLVEAKVGCCYTITACFAEISLRRRLAELGFAKRQKLEVISVSPLKNSFLVSVRGSVVAIRKSVARLIEVN